MELCVEREVDISVHSELKVKGEISGKDFSGKPGLCYQSHLRLREIEACDSFDYHFTLWVAS